MPECVYGIELIPGCRFLVSNRENYATLVYTCGLYDFADMMFLLHALRAGDDFADIGANVGSYSVLAGSAGANVLSVEPVPSTFQRLTENRLLNRVSGIAFNGGLSEAVGELEFTTELGGLNRVAALIDRARSSILVPITTLDNLVSEHDIRPLVVKIDVEGFELPVLRGAARTLKEHISAIIVELNGSGRLYGFSDEAVHAELATAGFVPSTYEPGTRAISELPGPNRTGLNTIYVKRKSFDSVQRRVRESPPINTFFGSY
ncbi:MAG: FkbM family methyltransferase [Burkholderiaceae bacterium]